MRPNSIDLGGTIYQMNGTIRNIRSVNISHNTLVALLY
jgi:hypothetical protein